MRRSHPIPLLTPSLLVCGLVLGLGLPGQAVAWQVPGPPDELEVWPPPGTTIPADGVILLEGRGIYREQIEKIAGGAILEDQGRGVKLNVLEMGPGEHQGSLQVLLAPAVPLQANTDYTLRLALGAPTYDVINPRIRMPGGQREPARWKTLGYRTQPPAAPRIVGEVQQTIACRMSDAENGFDLMAPIEDLEAHSLLKIRVYRLDQHAGADTDAPTAEKQAVAECLARGWSDDLKRTSFRTCSIPPWHPSGPLEIEVRPMNARGQLGEAVTLQQSWPGMSP